LFFVECARSAFLVVLLGNASSKCVLVGWTGRADLPGVRVSRRDWMLSAERNLWSAWPLLFLDSGLTCCENSHLWSSKQQLNSDREKQESGEWGPVYASLARQRCITYKFEPWLSVS